jgi:zinc/manganese transport system ATP-binding protein
MEQTKGVIELKNATLKFGNRTLWTGLDSSIHAGEFVAILGPNGTGKSTLLKVLLGLTPLTDGSVRLQGKLPGQDNKHIGYVPQQKNFDRSLPIRGRDLVELGLNGNQFGWHNHASASHKVDEAIATVHAESFADMPIGLLSGGEQQRLRIAQALVASPQILLCDEPLLSLDLNSQNTIINALNDYRTRTHAAIVFVTHEINPVLPFVDRVLYIANGKWIIDTPEKVLQSAILTNLYGSSVDVIKHNGRLLVIGADEAAHTTEGAHHEDHA